MLMNRKIRLCPYFKNVFNVLNIDRREYTLDQSCASMEEDATLKKGCSCGVPGGHQQGAYVLHAVDECCYYPAENWF